MFNVLKLLIPALLPSWNFFDYITPSPRIQFTLLKHENDIPTHWQEYRPRPIHLSVIQMLKRMLWNSHWNETMFVMGCAERLAVNHNPEHSENEILNRIISDLKNPTSNIDVSDITHIQFRLVFIEREETNLVEEITYHSRIQSIKDTS